jgi:hypothetical protein
MLENSSVAERLAASQELSSIELVMTVMTTGMVWHGKIVNIITSHIQPIKY